MCKFIVFLSIMLRPFRPFPIHFVHLVFLNTKSRMHKGNFAEIGRLVGAGDATVAMTSLY